MDIDPKWKSLASVVLATFVSGLVTKLTADTAMGIPPEAQWRATLIVAALAGLSAVAHLFQTPPAEASAAFRAKMTARRASGGFSRLGPLLFLAGLATAASVLLAGLQACRPARSALETAITLEQRACVLADVIGPELGVPAKTTAEIRTDCGLADKALEVVQEIVDRFSPEERGTAVALIRMRDASMLSGRPWPSAAPGPLPRRATAPAPSGTR